jgi:hypothetical protein
VIGQMELKMADVYASYKHANLHSWSYLLNPYTNFDKIAGYFKYSINVVEAGEPRVSLH